MEVILSRSQKEEKKGEGSLSVGNRKTSKKITVQGEVSWTLEIWNTPCFCSGENAGLWLG